MATPALSFRGAGTRLLSSQDILSAGVGLPFATSGGLHWSGVEVHRYNLEAGGTTEHTYPHVGIFMSRAAAPVNAELFAAGKRHPARVGSETVSIIPAGVPVHSRWDGALQVTSIFLDPATVMEVARAESGRDLPEVRLRYGVSDPLIRSIGMMLDAELCAERPSPRIYAESLATALAAHIYAKYSASAGIWKATGRNATQIRRSIEYIKENLQRDLTLTEVAAVANMSKYHFAKSFRQMTGIAPHQYLVKLRVDKARRMLADETVSVEEIASRVGYADKGHFAAQFMKIMGVSPSRYRLGI